MSFSPSRPTAGFEKTSPRTTNIAAKLSAGTEGETKDPASDVRGERQIPTHVSNFLI